MSVTTVAVLGCGLIGASWAALFEAVGGYAVRAWDPSQAARDAFADKVLRAREHLVALGATGRGSLCVCDELADAVRSADWVQENAPERIELKLDLLGRLDRLIGPQTVVATSTSSFTWSQLAAQLGYQARFVVAHPFNPPHLIPLVELFCPDARTLQRAVAFFESVDRVPVRLKREATGHIGNRLASALWREAVNIVAEGIADVADVDQVLIHGPGLRWSIVGTHLGYHLGGGAGGIEHYLRHLGPSQEQRWLTLGNPRLTPDVCEALVRGVHKEAAGRSIEELEQMRDAQLIETLRARRAHPALLSSSHPIAREAIMHSEQQQITATINNYFDGLFRGDTQLLKSVFDPQAVLVGEVRGKPYRNSIDGFLDATAKRKSPRELGEKFDMELLGVEVMNNVAYVRARCPMLGLTYFDFLALTRDGDRWLITNKLFTHA